METPHSFLTGCPRSGCSNSASLQEAQGHGESLPGCGGFTAVGLVFRVHLGSKPLPSKLVRRCWSRRCGKGFAWYNKEGMYYCSDSRNRHILQICGSSWAHGAVSAFADRIKYARGETGFDINSSAQHLLICDWRGNHFRSRLLPSSTALPEEFTWCNQVGVHYFTESRKQHIPQFCGSCWLLRSVSDRFQFAHGGKGIDINRSVQHLLNCGGVSSCHGGFENVLKLLPCARVVRLCSSVTICLGCRDRHQCATHLQQVPFYCVLQRQRSCPWGSVHPYRLPTSRAGWSWQLR